MEETTKVFIKRIPPSNNFTTASTANGAIFDQLKFTVCLPVDKLTGRIKNPVDGWTKEEIAGFEEELGVLPGYLKSEDFLYNYKVAVPQKGKWLMMSEPKHQLEYMVLALQANVAKDSTELPSVSKSSNEAVFLMTNTQDEAKLKNSKSQNKIKAFREFTKMGPEEKRDVLIFLGRNAYTMSQEIIENHVIEELEKDPKKFLDIIESDNFKDVIFVNKCVFHGVLEQKGKAYSHGGAIIATSMETAIHFLNEGTNQTLRLSILNELQQKEKIKESVPVEAIKKPKIGRPGRPKAE